ncbi:MAG: threonine--tRNA ligase [Oligoflexia bacterium]|nr:threonine--tRNA ligase [Oligoflexia bacterium]MBF0366258.1 threonine--tRNA ligase [Oligoflexia bacterium]
MGQQKKNYDQHDIETIRHSAAHIMAQAILRIFSGKGDKIQLGIGPTIENGFYYDIDMNHRLSEEDFARIESEMQAIIKSDLPIERKVLSRSEAIQFFSGQGQELKVELIAGLPEGEEIGCYVQGEFHDLCRGPHVERTSHVPMHFKLLSVAGAYWRGREDQKMLQRVYATCFKKEQELKDYLHFIEDAKNRDHRKLGKELDLFLFDPHAPGSPFFMPKGVVVYNELMNFIRRLYHRFNYQEVITPQVLDAELWKTSGHYANFHDDMFFTNIEEREFALKPMNCPAAMVMFKHFKFSYRELPLRFADFGRLHRYEKSGTLAGLTRVRTFIQDDAHIFLALSDIQREISDLIEMFFMCYRHFKFTDVKVNLSTRPEKRMGEERSWDIAEEALREALAANKCEYKVNEGDGAFYGPKIDFRVADALKREHQLGTIQLDFQLPERFDLKFVNPKGEMERPVVIHRALLGSIERFFGIYLEHIAGAFPFWIAPEQVVIVPVKNDSEAQIAYADELHAELKHKGFRSRVDARNESMNLKTRQVQTAKVPYMLVVGDREVEKGEVSARRYGEKSSKTLSKTELMELFSTLSEEKNP